jgi:hypothetical protein
MVIPAGGRSTDGTLQLPEGPAANFIRQLAPLIRAAIDVHQGAPDVASRRCPRLAHRKEKNARLDFGDAYDRCGAVTPLWLHHFREALDAAKRT